MAYDSRDGGSVSGGGGGGRDIPIRSRRARAASDAYNDYSGGGGRSPPYPSSTLTGQANARGPRNGSGGSGGSDDRRRPPDDARDKVKEKDKQDKDRDRAPRRPRTGSDASDESVMGQYVKHRDGNVEFISSGDGKGRRSGGDDNRRARLDRDARRTRDDRDLYNDRAPARRKSSYDDDYDTAPRSMGGRKASLAGAAAGAAAGYAAGAARPRRPGPRRYDDGEDDDSYTAAPRARRWRRGSGHYEDLGYDSERPRPTRRPYDDDDHAYAGRDVYGRPAIRRPRPAPDRYERRRYDDDEDVYYGGRRSMIDDDRGGLRRSKSDRRGPDRDRRRGDRDRRDKGDKNDWKQQGLVLFQTAALPLIKKEGGRFVKKSLESFLASQGR